jgi:hypothetical protein
MQLFRDVGSLTIFAAMAKDQAAGTSIIHLARRVPNLHKEN